MKKILTFAALLSATLLSQAGPVQVMGNTQGQPIHFTRDHSVDIASSGLFSFSLRSASYGVDDFNLSSVRFSKEAQSIVFDALADGSQLKFMGLSTDLFALDPEDPDFLVNRFSREYSLGSAFLAAGTWTVSFSGTDTDNKALSEYRLGLNTSQVPEPLSLALLIGALAPALLMSRKRRSV